ncbi:MAG: hypothetical protein ACE5G2_03165 [Candidatus Krumholzibacteriia bacterium]
MRRAIDGRGRAGGLERVLVALSLLVGFSTPGSASAAESPSLHATVRYTTPGSREVWISGWVQHVRRDSLDLVRRLPSVARVAWLEAHLPSEIHMLYPRRARPETYRLPVPRHTPLAWVYDVELADAQAVQEALPFVVGPDYVCLWLGSVLALPRGTHSQGDPEAAVDPESIALGASLPEAWALLGPWPRGGKGFRPRSVDTLADNFMAFGAWRVQERLVRDAGAQAQACTLVVAVAGSLRVTDSEWMDLVAERLEGEVAARCHGRALVFVAPASRKPVWFVAAASHLLLWPAQADCPEPQELRGLLTRVAGPG